MPVQAPSPLSAQDLNASQPVAAGLYIEPGVGGTITALVYDATGSLIREDHIDAAHFDAATLRALTEWTNRHQHLPAARPKLG